jgi:hypothetical protein
MVYDYVIFSNFQAGGAVNKAIPGWGKVAVGVFLFYRNIDRALSVSCVNIAVSSLSFLSEYNFARGLTM